VPITAEASRTSAVTRRAAWFGLAVLTLINLLNYLDRYVVPPLGESLRTSPLHVTDPQFGILASAFILVYMAAAPAFGVLGDKGSRPRLLALGVGLWSVATVLAGFASNYTWLLGARAAVGIGEAAYGSIAPALLADYFPDRQRSRVFAVMFMAIPVGTALGYVVGGAMDAHFGWRAAFFVAGAPGLLLAGLSLGLLDPPRGAQDVVATPAAAPRGFAAYLDVARIREYRHTVFGYAAYTFALGGIVAWMPTFLVRVRHLTGQSASVTLGAVLLATGFVGTFAGGWIADALHRLIPNANLVVSGVTTLLAAPLAYVALTSPNHSVYWPALAAAEVLIFMSTGPINSAIVDAVPAVMRASAMAASVFTIHILGDVPSPYLIGTMAEHTGLGHAVLLVPAAVLVAGLWWLYAATVPRAPAR
jgi:MFS transporter, Spinster family, sphingosine-1-phosphate transporter